MSQSSARYERRSSVALLPRDPTRRGTHTAAGRSRSRSSSDSASFHDRRNAATTGEAHAGASLHGSPAMYDTASMMHMSRSPVGATVGE
jgi:hypothetical protein